MTAMVMTMILTRLTADSFRLRGDYGKPLEEAHFIGAQSEMSTQLPVV